MVATLQYESAEGKPAKPAWRRWVAVFLAPLLGGAYGMLSQHGGWGGWMLMLIFLVAAPLICAWLLDRWRAWIAMELNGSAMLGSLAYGYFILGPSPSLSMAFVNEGTIFLLLVSLAFAQLAWVHD